MKITYRKQDEQMGIFEFDDAYFIGLASRGQYVGNPVFRNGSARNPVVTDEEWLLNAIEKIKNKLRGQLDDMSKEEILEEIKTHYEDFVDSSKKLHTLKDEMPPELIDEICPEDKIIVFFRGDWFEYDPWVEQIRDIRTLYTPEEWPAHWFNDNWQEKHI